MDKKYIMIIDDEVSVGDLLSSMMGMMGYKSTIFNSGDDAIAYYHTNYDDVGMVITDLSMTGMTGVDVVKEILIINPKESIMVLTGFIKDNIMHFFEYDSVEIVNKPFTIQEMRTKIASMIEKKEARKRSV